MIERNLRILRVDFEKNEVVFNIDGKFELKTTFGCSFLTYEEDENIIQRLREIALSKYIFDDILSNYFTFVHNVGLITFETYRELIDK